MLNYTVHHILKALPAHEKPIDKCIPFILPGLREELFGTLREEKETQESRAAKLYKEARGGLVEESLVILATRINFKETALTLIKPLEEVLERSGASARVLNKCNEGFQALVSGFVRNPGLTEEDALLFIYGVIDQSKRI